MKFHTTLKNPAGLFYGWRMVALGCAVRILGGGLYRYGFTVFFLPLSNDLGLSRTATSMVFSLARGQAAIEGPLAGYLIDRLGPRPVMLTAVITAGLGYVILSGVDSYVALLVVYLGVISLVYQAGFMDATMVIANTWFIRRRAMAMALISASIGMGGALLTPLLSLAVQAWGWRSAAIAAGVTFLLVGVPLSSFVRRSPETMGLRPDGSGQPGASQASRFGDIEETNFTLSEATRTLAFWLLAVATTLRVAGLSAVTVHFVPMIVWKGLSQAQAAFLLGALAFLSLPSHLLIGWIADRAYKPRVMAFSMVVASLSLVLLIYARRDWQLWLFLPLFTVVESIFPVTWATLGDFFGRKHFAKIRGVMSFFYMWGGVAGPVLMGASYDYAQSYAPAIWSLVGLFLMTTLFYAFLLPPPRRGGSSA